ncbi:uncharacterized protein LOC119031531 [Acanthopagrus latus]|uniref:uncharacterized protein LOC119031531 n=1 Tax=Acanthopagrus latus TaxID=8177 RepID=UPI00187C5C88|nr:uncharacterized protein LOC119031531 [Acanthopagrus latus]
MCPPVIMSLHTEMSLCRGRQSDKLTQRHQETSSAGRSFAVECLFRAKLSVTTRLMGLAMCATFFCWSCDAFLKFSIPPVSEGVRVYDETGIEVDADVFEEVAQQPNVAVFTIRFDGGSQGTTSSSCSQRTASSASPLLDVATNSELELSACSSNDTIILAEDDSPSRKRQKANKDAKHLVQSALTNKPGGDCIVKEYSRRYD